MTMRYHGRMTPPIRVTRRSLRDEDDPMRDYAERSPAERIALVWELTLQGLAFQGWTDAEPRLARDTVHIHRRAD